MIINLVILALLIWSYMIGYSRGLIVQAIYTVGAVFAAVVAAGAYKPLAKTLSMWVPFASATQDSHFLIFSDRLLFQADEAFYAGLAFVLITLVVYVIVRLVGLFLPLLAMPFGKRGKLISGLLSVVVTYVFLQMIFTTLALVPMASVQAHLNGSFLVRSMLLYTPISSGMIQHLFIQNIVHLNPLG